MPNKSKHKTPSTQLDGDSEAIPDQTREEKNNVTACLVAAASAARSLQTDQSIVFPRYYMYTPPPPPPPPSPYHSLCSGIVHALPPFCPSQTNTPSLSADPKPHPPCLAPQSPSCLLVPLTITIYFIHPSGKLKMSFDRTTKNISQ